MTSSSFPNAPPRVRFKRDHPPSSFCSAGSSKTSRPTTAKTSDSILKPSRTRKRCSISPTAVYLKQYLKGALSARTGSSSSSSAPPTSLCSQELPCGRGSTRNGKATSKGAQKAASHGYLPDRDSPTVAVNTKSRRQTRSTRNRQVALNDASGAAKDICVREATKPSKMEPCLYPWSPTTVAQTSRIANAHHSPTTVAQTSRVANAPPVPRRGGSKSVVRKRSGSRRNIANNGGTLATKTAAVHASIMRPTVPQPQASSSSMIPRPMTRFGNRPAASSSFPIPQSDKHRGPQVRVGRSDVPDKEAGPVGPSQPPNRLPLPHPAWALAAMQAVKAGYPGSSQPLQTPLVSHPSWATAITPTNMPVVCDGAQPRPTNMPVVCDGAQPRKLLPAPATSPPCSVAQSKTGKQPKTVAQPPTIANLKTPEYKSGGPSDVFVPYLWEFTDAQMEQLAESLGPLELPDAVLEVLWHKEVDAVLERAKAKKLILRQYLKDEAENNPPPGVPRAKLVSRREAKITWEYRLIQIAELQQHVRTLVKKNAMLSAGNNRMRARMLSFQASSSKHGGRGHKG